MLSIFNLNNNSRWSLWVKAIILTLPMLFITYFVMGAYAVLVPPEYLMEWGLTAERIPLYKISKAMTYIFMNTIFFMIFYTGKIDRYRSMLFIIIALTFPVDFIVSLWELRGHFMVATPENIVCGEVPFCHIVIPQSIIPMIAQKAVIFPGSISKFSYSISFMIVLWISVSLALGRGWCSWVCFYGGWEEGCSKIRKKPLIKLPQKLKYVPFAILMAVVLTSMTMFTATYCWWLCPFKAVSEFVQINSWIGVVQTIIFIVIFLGLCIILPILSKKRTQCMTLCPFGAFQSIVDKVNVFDIRIETDKCTNCSRCINECPVSSINQKTLKAGRTGFTCLKCGKCIDVCKKDAVHFHIKGTEVGKFKNLSRYLFFYLAFTIIAAVGGGFISGAISRIGQLITTGSITY